MALVIYGINCLVAGVWKPLELPKLLVYFLTTAAIGLFGEIFLNTVYNFFVGQPLWYYRIAPIYGGYTSSYAIVTWGLYGFHFYLLHDTLKTKWSIVRTRHLALIISVEALLLESLLTLSAKPVFGTLMYNYTPSDLWHVTSIQNIPFYFIFGAVATKTLLRARKDPLFFSLGSIFLLVVLLVVTHVNV